MVISSTTYCPYLWDTPKILLSYFSPIINTVDWNKIKCKDTTAMFLTLIVLEKYVILDVCVQVRETAVRNTTLRGLFKMAAVPHDRVWLDPTSSPGFLGCGLREQIMPIDGLVPRTNIRTHFRAKFIILQIFFEQAQLWKLGNVTRLFPRFSWGLFSHMTRLDQSRVSENTW